MFIRLRVSAAAVDPRAATVPLGATEGGRVPCAAPGAPAAAGGGGTPAAARRRQRTTPSRRCTPRGPAARMNIY